MSRVGWSLNLPPTLDHLPRSFAILPSYAVPVRRHMPGWWRGHPGRSCFLVRPSRDRRSSRAHVRTNAARAALGHEDPFPGAEAEGPLWVGCGPTDLAARPGLQSESNFRFRCYSTPNSWSERGAWRCAMPIRSAASIASTGASPWLQCSNSPHAAAAIALK